MEYRNEFGYWPLTTTAGYGPAGGALYYLARRGSNEWGGFTDYLLEDDPGTPTSGQLGQLDFHGWIDTDGFIRVYDVGKIHIFDSIPTTPDYSGARGAGTMNSCGNMNAVYYEGKTFFGTEGKVNSVRGQTFNIPNWKTGQTNYGISTDANALPWGANRIILADSKEMIIDVADGLTAETSLVKGARHLGKVNYMMGDGSVRTAHPLDISPRLRPEKWRP